MYNKEQIKVSNVAGIGMTFFTAASPIGWDIAGGYALVDLGIIGFTGNSVDDYLDTFSENYFGLENGVLLDFND